MRAAAQLGFPTANMRLDGYLKPAFGVYAVRATIIENEKPLGAHDGVANLGIRPMFKTDTPLLETYLFDFTAICTASIWRSNWSPIFVPK